VFSAVVPEASAVMTAASAVFNSDSRRWTSVIVMFPPASKSRFPRS
jgi:hypothetical protein